MSEHETVGYELNGRVFELRTYGPGKYDHEVDAVVDDGDCFDETMGDVDGPGHYGLMGGPFPAEAFEGAHLSGAMRELTVDERAFLMAVAGAIIYTDSQGFVTVSYYADAAELAANWKNVADYVGNFYEAEGIDE